MKLLLREFVDWLEECHLQQAPCGSPFEELVDPAEAAKVEIAYDWAKATGKRVELYTTTLSARAVLAELVLRRCGLTLESVCNGELDDGAFEILALRLSQISRSGLVLKQAAPPPGMAQTCFFSGPLFARLTF